LLHRGQPLAILRLLLHWKALVHAEKSRLVGISVTGRKQRLEVLRPRGGWLPVAASLAGLEPPFLEQDLQPWGLMLQLRAVAQMIQAEMAQRRKPEMGLATAPRDLPTVLPWL
jgi:hypothetical protein